MKNKALFLLSIVLSIVLIGCETCKEKWVLLSEEFPVYVDLRTQRDPDKPLKAQPEYSEQLKRYFAKNKISSTGVDRHISVLSDGEKCKVFYEGFESSGVASNDRWSDYVENIYLETDKTGWITRNYEISQEEYYHRIWKADFIESVILAVVLSILTILLAYAFVDWLIDKEEKWKLIITETPTYSKGRRDKWSDYDSTN